MSAQSKSWGVEAVGVHGQTSAELLSSVEDGDSWLLQIATARWHFAVSIEGPSAVPAAANFIDEYAGREEFAEHKLGIFHSAEVVLVKDSEYADRFWIRARGSGQLLEVAILGSDAIEFQRTMRQLAEEVRGR